MGRQHSRLVATAVGGFAALQLATACAAVDGTRGGTEGSRLLAAANVNNSTGSGVVQTKWGPLSPADRDLLVKVRLAGLWEIPVGRQARERAARAKTRQHLGMMGDQHVTLDADVRRVAARLRVPLPNEPNADQQGWMAEIASKTGVAWDRTAVLRLRQAHGRVFPAIASVRASTQNTLIRDFAERAAKFVNGHMDMLEATGFAGPSTLPPPPEVTGAPDVVPAGSSLPNMPPVTSLPDPDGTGTGSDLQPVTSTQGLVQAPGGPLSPADRDLLVKVRLAGLWENPVGKLAAKRAALPKTRQHLGMIGQQHATLDADVLQVAKQLRVPLPNTPNSDQLGFIADMLSQTGEDFDRTAVKHLRLAHGKVFPVIAQVRASTQNKVIRDFAERAAKFVNGHMDMLEATGLAGPEALPPAPEVDQAPDVVATGKSFSAAPAALNVVGVFPTEFGPLSPADRDLLVKVRQAGLWEIPVGREAQKSAARAKTKQHLGMMADQHVELDEEVRKVAARLRVPLPDEASADQQAWMKEIFSKKGVAWDRTAVLRLRQAHGKVYGAIAQVRGSTQNTLIREFADTASKFVNGHMAMLEATGFVDANALPPAPEAPSAPAPAPSGQPAPSAPPAISLPGVNR